jgi:CHAD domain-containing protein
MTAPAPNPDPVILKFLAATLEPRVKKVGKQARRAVKHPKEPENVHQTRVATRRLRTALHSFADVLPAARASKWNKQIRSVTRELGHARDLDVQLLWLETRIREQPDFVVRGGLSWLYNRKLKARNAIRKHVDAAMKQLEKSGVLKQIASWLATLPPHPARVRSSRALRLFAFEQINKAIDEVRAHESALADPANITGHHELRIATKHLRYSLELFGPLFPNGLIKWIETAQYAQEVLGELHDLDVWMKLLPDELKKAHKLRLRRGPLDLRRVDLGAEWLTAYCLAKRSAQHAAITEWWLQHAGPKNWALLHTQLCDQISIPRKLKT